MKNIIEKLTPGIKAIICLLLFMLIFRLSASLLVFKVQRQHKNVVHQEEERKEDANREPKKIDLTDYITEAASEETKIKNAGGNFVMQLQQWLDEKEFGKIYSFVNQDIIRDYSYQCNKTEFIESMEAFSGLYQASEWTFLTVRQLEPLSSGGIIFELSLEQQYSKEGERVYNARSSRQVDYTLYYNAQGEVASFLPFPEPLIKQYAGNYGIREAE